MHQRASDHEALRHAAGIAIHFFVLPIAQSEFTEKLARSSVALLPRDAVVGGMKGEDLADFETAVEIALLRDNRDSPLRCDRIARDIDAHERG